MPKHIWSYVCPYIWSYICSSLVSLGANPTLTISHSPFLCRLWLTTPALPCTTSNVLQLLRFAHTFSLITSQFICLSFFAQHNEFSVDVIIWNSWLMMTHFRNGFDNLQRRFGKILNMVVKVCARTAQCSYSIVEIGWSKKESYFTRLLWLEAANSLYNTTQYSRRRT